MVSKEDIPSIAICPKCGQPMKVVFLAPLAAKLGVKVPDGASVINCCETELTIDDEELAIWVTGLLLEYHRSPDNSLDPSS